MKANFEGYNTKQKEIINNANARWNLYTGAVRSGKSYIGNDMIIKRLSELPEGRRALIGKTETTIMRNILDPLQDKYGTSVISDIQGKKREATIFGKKFYCIGANDKRATKKLQGGGFVYAFGDEITTWPKSFFEMLKSRLSDAGAKFDGTCNPENPNHWLKEMVIDREDLNVYHKHFTINDNPVLSDAFVNELKKEYTGVWYQRMILGRWVQAEGVIYDMFDEDKHVVDELPEMKQYWIGCDYGTANPTTFLLIGLGADNKLYIIDEYRHDGKRKVSKTDKQYAEDLKQFISKHDITPKWIFIDPSAKSFITQVHQLRHNFNPFRNVAKANNEVLDGIRKVSSLLGAGKLLIHERCQGLIDEKHAYSWDPKAQEKGEDKRLKENDHACDAERYVVNSIGRVYEQIMKAGE